MAADIIAANNAGLAMIGNLATQVGTLQEELDNSDQELANQTIGSIACNSPCSPGNRCRPSEVSVWWQEHVFLPAMPA